MQGRPRGVRNALCLPLEGGKLVKLAPDFDLDQAIWVDLYKPLPAQAAAVVALGVDVPTLADMEEIEISNRLYRDPYADYITVVLPGQSETKEPIAARSVSS